MNRALKRSVARTPGQAGAELENHFILRLPQVSVFNLLKVLYVTLPFCIMDFHLSNMPAFQFACISNSLLFSQIPMSARGHNPTDQNVIGLILRMKTLKRNLTFSNKPNLS